MESGWGPSDSHSTQYAHDTENNLVPITDANGHVTSFGYDAYGDARRHFLDLETMSQTLLVVPEPSRTVLAIAGFAGLRRGEIEGLLWESYDGQTLKVTRVIWQRIAGEPKSKNSKASFVPVIAPLRLLLDGDRIRCGNPETGIMFKTRNKTPLSMNNLLNDQIRPAIEECLRCKIQEHTR